MQRNRKNLVTMAFSLRPVHKAVIERVAGKITPHHWATIDKSAALRSIIEEWERSIGENSIQGQTQVPDEKYAWFLLEFDGLTTAEYCRRDNPLYGRFGWDFVAGPFESYQEALSAPKAEA